MLRITTPIPWIPLSWSGYNKATEGDLISGMVVTVKDGTGNQVAKAAGGRFRGFIFSEMSAQLDESLSGAPPAVISGGATVTVFRHVLPDGSALAAGDFVTTGTGVNAGRLVKATIGGTTPTAETALVGKVQEVHGNAVKIKSFPATT